MLASSSLYKQAIHAPHKLATKVDLYAGPGGALLERDVPVFGGSISGNLTHRVTRRGAFILGPEFWPTSATSPLTPYQTVAQIRAGIQYGDGSEELFPVFTGRVGEVTRNADGDISAQVEDLAADVVAWRFEEPRNSENVSIITQIERLIREVIPSAVFGPHDVTDAPTPRLTWDEDRGKALDDLAAAVGGRWYALGDGTFVVRRFPYDVGTPVQDIFDGPSGLLVSGAPTLSREGAANSVTVIVERFDGGTPFRVTARDNSPTSPTRWGGPFGNVTLPIKVQTPLTVGEATQYARAQLNASTALSSTWSIASVPDYTLEPGDTVRAESRGVRSTQLIDSITYPLAPATMNLGTRAYVRAQATVD
ncbi:MAG TPA: DUF5047 domain-containing protein [Pyrinomonadaceae bacterium]|nr:DUF5047 domain-containing protein [Pyrinomonadaceae bacterium]